AWIRTDQATLASALLGHSERRNFGNDGAERILFWPTNEEYRSGLLCLALLRPVKILMGVLDAASVWAGAFDGYGFAGHGGVEGVVDVVVGAFQVGLVGGGFGVDCCV